MQCIMSFGYKKFLPGVAILLSLLAVLTSCGGSSGTATSTSSQGSASMAANSKAQTTQSQAASANQVSTPGNSSATGAQYLVKTLKVTMQVKDTRKVANDLQSWISTTDTRSTSTSTDYEQVGNNLYTITLAFSVQSLLYPRIYTYLRDYTTQTGGHLTAFTESVQDVTGDYVDTQSRLKSLHAEQSRLLDLMSHAQALGDIITIEQKLTDVETQIETYEGRLNNLNSQITFYTVQIDLQPIEPAAPPPPAWSIPQVFQQAFAASLIFAQTLLTLLIWLIAFCIYIIPIILLIWLFRKFRPGLSKAIPHIMTASQHMKNE